MQYDRKITISAGNNRRAMNWTPQTMLISELWARLRTPARGTEPLAEYLNMKKAQQDDLKDVGGFMAGPLSGPRRKANAVTGRDILTLDLDNIPAGGTEDVLRRVDGLGCGYCIYSTRKHSPAAPRLRVLLPLDRTVSADEYEPLARKAAEFIGMELMDPTTFEVSRLMYWPSCCADSQYIYLWQDRPLISANGLLAKYEDWRDCALWPQVPGAVSLPKLAVKQGDPEGKKGVVGAFCRTYDVFRAMDELIPGMYEPVDNMPGRYTYLGGSTTGGAVVYDNGKFLYSHHATDPCSNRLVNAFDLVRLHRFGDKDDEAQPGTPTNRLPSYVAMCELAVQDAGVAALMSQERYQEAVQDFEGVAGDNDEDPANWMTLLALNTQTGLPKATIDNVWIILEHDPLLKGRFALNRFAGRGEVLGALPWDARTVRRLWDDNDNEGLYWYMERYHHITGNGKIDGALSLHSEKHKFNDVRNYLAKLQWDGHPRLDTLLIEYLGAADSPYVRAVTRKAFTAAVARAMEPGCKYDTMLILSGPQGIGKSTLLDKMSRGWFNDGIRTFEGKEASELIQGVWLVEIGELDAFRQTDVSRIKQFLSLRADRFRAAYGRHVKDLPRCCVFFGTTNTAAFLRDRTGNRRFWPVDVGVQTRIKTVWEYLDAEVDQIWAEAVMRWRLGESLFLTGEIENAAKAEQESHREVSSKEGIIIDFVDKPVPEDWQKWTLDKRRMFLNGTVEGNVTLVPRDRICALEIWCEAFGGSPKDFRYSESAEINDILRSLPGWEKTPNGLRFGYCGYQRGFVRKDR